MPFTVRIVISLYAVIGLHWFYLAIEGLHPNSQGSAIVSACIPPILMFFIAYSLYFRKDKAYEVALSSILITLFLLWKLLDRYFYELSLVAAFSEFPILWAYLTPFIPFTLLLLPQSRSYFRSSK